MSPPLHIEADAHRFENRYFAHAELVAETRTRKVLKSARADASTHQEALQRAIEKLRD